MKNKLKRMLCIASICLLSAGTVALTAAAVEGTLSDGGLTLDGYITGVEGPLTITDKIWYNASLSGSDADYVPNPDFAGSGDEVYVIPGTDTKTLSKVYLWADDKVVYGNEVSCGYGGSRAILQMHIPSKNKTISEALQ